MRSSVSCSDFAFVRDSADDSNIVPEQSTLSRSDVDGHHVHEPCFDVPIESSPSEGSISSYAVLCVRNDYLALSSQYSNFSNCLLHGALKSYTRTFALHSELASAETGDSRSCAGSSNCDFRQDHAGVPCSRMDETEVKGASAKDNESESDGRVEGADCSVPGVHSQFGDYGVFLPDYHNCDLIYELGYCSIHKYIVSGIDICDSEFEDFITKSVMSSVRRKIGRYGLDFYRSCSLDLSVTRSNVRSRVMDKVRSCLLDIFDGKNIVLSEGMSIGDIKSFMLSGDFYSRLSEKFKLIGENVLSSEKDDIPLVVQSKVSITSVRLGLVRALSLSPGRRRSLDFIVNTRNMLARTILSLPLKIFSVIDSSTEIDIKDWLFLDCHGVCIYKPFLKEVIVICLDIRKKILEDQTLLDSLDEISKNISKNKFRSIASIVHFHKIVNGGMSMYSYISDLASGFSCDLLSKLKESIVLLPNNKLGKLSEQMAETVSKHFIIDTVMLSLQSCRELCRRKRYQNISLLIP